MPDQYATTVLQRCDALAAFSEDDDRLTRRFATPALRAAGDAVAGWMREAGMATRRDAIGNAIGRLEGGGHGTLLMGSHLDTVRDAGRYDGPLGVLVAIAGAQRLRDEGGELPFALEVLAFADEEGVRYGTAYLGSSVVAGRFDRALLERRDADGIAMAEAIAAFGGDVGGLAGARRDPEGLLGYVEVHIEQGPVLEAEGVAVGVVSAINGQTRAAVTFTGAAGHAGTVPMALRRDALTAAAEWILAVEELARDDATQTPSGSGTGALVATVGEAGVAPGASNVIPGRVALSLDVRHADDATREAARDRLRDRARAIAAARGLAVDWAVVQETAAVACFPKLTEALAGAVRDGGHPVVRLTSGAGHDAAVMAALTPVAMLFMRCAGGISHSPEEAVAPADVASAIDVVVRFLARRPLRSSSAGVGGASRPGR
jgi:allantoate deiminase